MAIKQYLEEAMKKIAADRDREVSLLKQQVTQEKIIPHNAEIDNVSNTAIAKLQNELAERTSVEQQSHNARVLALQQDFAQKKQEIVDAGIAEKEEFAKTTISSATANITLKYDTEIAKIREQIQALEE